MSTRIFWLTAIALAIPSAISAQSIHPFFKEDDVVFKPELLGKWDLEEMVLEFRDLGDKSYGISLALDRDSAFYFHAHLFCLGERCYLDGQVTQLKFPDSGAASAERDVPEFNAPADTKFAPDKTDFLLNRLHGLILISFGSEPNQFLASGWQNDWLPELADAGKLNIPYTRDDLGRVLLTAESDDLREWVKGLPSEAFETLHPVRRLKEKSKGKNSPSAPADHAPEAGPGNCKSGESGASAAKTESEAARAVSAT